MANHKKLKGRDEEITYEEACSYKDKAMTEFVYYLCALIDENTEDEEERANAKVKMSEKLGNLLYLSELSGALCDPNVFVSNIPYSEGVEIVEENA